MKELSFLMFMIGLFFGLTVLCRRITNPNHPDRAAFFIPSRMMFNLLWGSIFYIGYGILMFPDFWLRLCLSLLVAILLVYTLIMNNLKKKLLSPDTNISQRAKKIFDRAIEKQKLLDKNTKNYSRRKAAKILGLAAYDLETPELINKRLTALENAKKQGQISNDYLNEIIKHIKQALQN